MQHTVACSHKLHIDAAMQPPCNKAGSESIFEKNVVIEMERRQSFIFAMEINWLQRRRMFVVQ